MCALTDLDLVPLDLVPLSSIKNFNSILLILNLIDASDAKYVASQHKVGLLSLQGGQHDQPVQGGPEQLRWLVGYGAVPLEDVPADDDAHAAEAPDAGGVQTAVHRLLQPSGPAAEGRGGGHGPAVGRHPRLGQR